MFFIHNIAEILLKLALNTNQLFLSIVEMISDGTDEESNFEWQVSLRYHMDIHTILRAKTESVDVDVHPPYHQVRKGSRIRRGTLAKSKIEDTPG